MAKSSLIRVRNDRGLDDDKDRDKVENLVIYLGGETGCNCSYRRTNPNHRECEKHSLETCALAFYETRILLYRNSRKALWVFAWACLSCYHVASSVRGISLEITIPPCTEVAH